MFVIQIKFQSDNYAILKLTLFADKILMIIKLDNITNQELKCSNWDR